MERITITEYSRREGITVQAAHKRIRLKKDKRIVSVEKLSKQFFLLKFNPAKDLKQNATMLQK